MPWKRALPGMFVAGAKLEPQASNPFRLCDDRIDRFVCDPLIGRLQIPGFDALQVLLEALGEAK